MGILRPHSSTNMAALRVVLVVFVLLFAVDVAGELVFPKRELTPGVREGRLPREDGPLRILFFSMPVGDESQLRRLKELRSRDDVDVLVLIGLKTEVLPSTPAEGEHLGHVACDPREFVPKKQEASRTGGLVSIHQKPHQNTEANLKSSTRNVVLTRASKSLLVDCRRDVSSAAIRYNSASLYVLLPPAPMPPADQLLGARFLRFQVSEKGNKRVGEVTASSALQSAYRTTITVEQIGELVKVLIDVEKDPLDSMQPAPICTRPSTDIQRTADTPQQFTGPQFSELFDDLSESCGDRRFVVSHLEQYLDQAKAVPDTWARAMTIAKDNEKCAAALFCIGTSALVKQLTAKSMVQYLKDPGVSDERFYSKRNGILMSDHDSRVVEAASVWRLAVSYSVPPSWIAHLHRKTVDTVERAVELILYPKQKKIVSARPTSDARRKAYDAVVNAVKEAARTAGVEQGGQSSTEGGQSSTEGGQSSTEGGHSKTEEFDFADWLDPVELSRLEGHFGLRAFLCWIDTNRDSIRAPPFGTETSALFSARFCSFSADSHTNTVLQNAAAFYAFSQADILFPADSDAEDADVWKRIFPNYVHKEEWEREPLYTTAEAYSTVNRVLSMFASDSIPDLRTLESSLPRVVSLQRWLKRHKVRVDSTSVLPPDSFTTLFVCVESSKLHMQSSYFVNDGFLFATNDLHLLMSKCLGTMVLLTLRRGSLDPLQEAAYLLPPNSMFSQSIREFQGRETVLLTPYQSSILRPPPPSDSASSDEWKLEVEPAPDQVFADKRELLLKMLQPAQAPHAPQTASQLVTELPAQAVPERAPHNTPNNGELPSCSCRLCASDCSPPNPSEGRKCAHYDTTSMGGSEQDLNSFCTLSKTRLCTATEDGCKFRIDTLQTVIDSHVSQRLRDSGDGERDVLALLRNLVQISPLSSHNLHAAYQMAVSKDGMAVDEMSSIWALALANPTEATEAQLAQMGGVAAGLRALIPVAANTDLKAIHKTENDKIRGLIAAVQAVEHPVVGNTNPTGKAITEESIRRHLEELQDKYEEKGKAFIEGGGFVLNVETELAKKLDELVTKILLPELQQQLNRYKVVDATLDKCSGVLESMMGTDKPRCTKTLQKILKKKNAGKLPPICADLSNELCNILLIAVPPSASSYVTLLQQVPLIVPNTLLAQRAPKQAPTTETQFEKNIRNLINREENRKAYMTTFMRCVRQSVAQQTVTSMMAAMRESFETRLTSRMQQSFKQQRYALAAARYSSPSHELELGMLANAPVVLPAWLQQIVTHAAALPMAELLPYDVPKFTKADEDVFDGLDAQQQLGVEGLWALVSSCVSSPQ